METESMDASHQSQPPVQPDSTEVRLKRRKFSAEYKRRILAEASACKRGELGLLLRREGLYSSVLAAWRAQLRSGHQAVLTSKKRGPREGSSKAEHVRLQHDVAKLKEKLRQAELIIEVQKKLCTMLGLPMGGEIS